MVREKSSAGWPCKTRKAPEEDQVERAIIVGVAPGRLRPATWREGIGHQNKTRPLVAIEPVRVVIGAAIAAGRPKQVQSPIAVEVRCVRGHSFLPRPAKR